MDSKKELNKVLVFYAVLIVQLGLHSLFGDWIESLDSVVLRIICVFPFIILTIASLWLMIDVMPIMLKPIRCMLSFLRR